MIAHRAALLQGPSRETAIGRYAFSEDGGGSWVYAQEDAYNGTVVWSEGMWQ